ncbi:MAG: hypothetical protein QW379_03085 [Thermoplasmata archaeon]
MAGAGVRAGFGAGGGGEVGGDWVGGEGVKAGIHRERMRSRRSGSWSPERTNWEGEEE